MAKLVVLSAGFNGRTHELNVDKTTIGRVEDNTFQIADGSVSSHHCEIVLRGSDVVIHDLGSTNGSFINGEKITESVLKPGQTLKLGQIELQLVPDGAPMPAMKPAAAPVPGSPAAPAPAPHKQKADSTMVVPRGVNLNELSADSTRPGGFDTSGKGFSKKKNNSNMLFVYLGIGLVVVIGIVIVIVITQLH
jgi:pSer/pThr/pTyr-binding forkhead associated (FHA) protein